MRFNDYALGDSTTPVVTGPTAADMLLQQAIIHGSGTATILQNDTPMTANTQAILLAKIRGITMPPDGSFIKGATVGPFFFKSGRKQTINVPSAVPAGSIYTLTDDIVNGIAPDLVTTYQFTNSGAEIGCLTPPPDSFFSTYITVNLSLPVRGPDGCGIAWTAALTATWLPVLNAVLAQKAAAPTPTPTPTPAPAPAPTPPPPPPKGTKIQGWFGVFGDDDPSATVLANGGMIDSTTGDVSYLVQAGDSLSAIALKLGLCTKGPGNTTADWADCTAAAQNIATRNNLPDVNSIAVGQLLEIPMTIVADPVTGEATAMVMPPSSKVGWVLAGALVLGFFLFKGGESHGRRSK